jgi:ATP synthase protein I
VAIYLRKRTMARFDGAEKGPIYSAGPMAAGPNQDNPWSGWSTGFAISIYLLSAVLVWGGIGFLIDAWIGTEEKLFTGAGMVVGAVTGTYLIYLRYGKQDDEKR